MDTDKGEMTGKNYVISSSTYYVISSASEKSALNRGQAQSRSFASAQDDTASIEPNPSVFICVHLWLKNSLSCFPIFRVFVILALILAATVASASPSSKQVAELMKKGFAGVKDYKVDAVLTIKSESVNVTGMPMKVYYKHPGKVHIEATEGFAMVPRDMQLGNPAQEMAKNFDVKVLGTGKKAGRDAIQVQLIPKQPGQGRGVLKAWIDTERGLMLSMTGQDSNGPKVKSDWKYAKVQGKYWLPSEISAELTLPKQPSSSDPTDPDDRPSRRFHRPKMSNGAINIKFKNYKVNVGLPDSMFKKVER